MISIGCNSCVKSWKNKQRAPKINKKQKLTKIKPFIKKYDWKGIKFLWEKDDWKKFEKNNITVALNIL